MTNAQKKNSFLPNPAPIAAFSGKNCSNMLIIYYKIEYIAPVFPKNRSNILNFSNIE